MASNGGCSPPSGFPNCPVPQPQQFSIDWLSAVDQNCRPNATRNRTKATDTADNYSASLCWCRLSFGSHDQICPFILIWKYLHYKLGCPFWRDDGSVICIVVNLWTITVLYSHLWLRFSYSYPSGTGWSSFTPGTGFPFRRFLQLAGLQWRFSSPLPHGVDSLPKVEIGQPILVSGHHLGPETNLSLS